jgi:hypothetical protein
MSNAHEPYSVRCLYRNHHPWSSASRRTNKVLHTVRHIRAQEPSIGICQEVIDGIALWESNHCSSDALMSLSAVATRNSVSKEAGCNELSAKEEQSSLRGLAAISRPRSSVQASDLNNGGFKRSLVQVGRRGRLIGVNTTRHEGMLSIEQGNFPSPPGITKQQNRCLDTAAALTCLV